MDLILGKIINICENLFKHLKKAYHIGPLHKGIIVLILTYGTQLNKPGNYEEHAFDTEVLTEVEAPYSLVVWNDEVNSFDWVIQTLIEVCNHSTEQAEQCAMIIHTQGKYAVKQGQLRRIKTHV